LLLALQVAKYSDDGGVRIGVPWKLEPLAVGVAGDVDEVVLLEEVSEVDRLAWFEAVDSSEPKLLQVPQRNCRQAEILLLQKDKQSSNYHDNYSV